MTKLCLACETRPAVAKGDYCRRHMDEATRTRFLLKQANLCTNCQERPRVAGKGRCSQCITEAYQDKPYFRATIQSREYRLAANHNQRARKAGNSGLISESDVINLFASTTSCRYCGGDLIDPEIDHIHPLARGGDNEVYNLQVICQRCNYAKSDMTEAEFLEHIRRISRINP